MPQPSPLVVGGPPGGLPLSGAPGYGGVVGLMWDTGTRILFLDSSYEEVKNHFLFFFSNRHRSR